MDHEKEYDIIVWGASGFTGRLVAAYLNKKQSGLRWAMGGRNADKLKAVAAEIGADGAPIVTADAGDPAAMKAIAARTKLVCTTVGPYQKYGTNLVAACADTGTDYVDLCGEPAWMRAMIDAYEGQARQSGARIVFSCGFDSIPFDLGVHFVQTLAREAFGAPAREVKGVMKAMKGKFSGGTAASLVATIEAMGEDPTIRKVMVDPYSLAPDAARNRPRQSSLNRIYHDEDVGAWLAPFVMAAINTRNVHRTNMLTDYAYGEDFQYSEMAMAKSRMGATLAGLGLGAFSGALSVGPLRALMKKFVLPKPGEGPDRHERETGFYDARFFAKGPDGRVIAAKVTGDMDPGYGSTSKMLSEAALAMVEDIGKDDLAGGFWTPASAMGETLIRRLEASAGLRFERL